MYRRSFAANHWIEPKEPQKKKPTATFVGEYDNESDTKKSR